MKPFKTYPGGKEASGVYQKIISEIRPHDTLFVPFLGNCAVSRNMKKSPIRFGVDIDLNVVKAWKKIDHDFTYIYQDCGIERLKKIHYHRLSKVVVYIDPPYIIESRKAQAKIYDFELTLDQHKKLISHILWVNDNFSNVDILISHYDHPLYMEAFKNWRLKTFQASTRGGMATEYLWMNYENQEGLLHDYRYVGGNSVRRDNLKVKKRSMIKRFDKMKPKERNFLLHSLAEHFPIMKDFID